MLGSLRLETYDNPLVVHYAVPTTWLETQASAPSMKWVHISPRAEFVHYF